MKSLKEGTEKVVTAQWVAEEVAQIFMHHLKSGRLPAILRKKNVTDIDREVMIAAWAFDIATDVLNIDIAGVPIDGDPKPVKLIDLLT